MARENNNETCIDILKYIMAIFVIGIHTEPFGFNIWLDRGFGIITRLCVPFFFVTSAYFFWLKDNPAMHYLKRITFLYVVWSLIYLPFDIYALSHMTIVKILERFLWSGNEHALWYLCGSIIGFIITYMLLKVFKPRTVLAIGICLLLVGCIKSTWAPLIERVFSVEISDWLGSRNGLFYAFPYTALGMAIAKSKNRGKISNKKLLIIGFFASLILLAIESLVFVVLLKTPSTILWMSVFPGAYFLFLLGNNASVNIKNETSFYFRKISTLIYVSQYLFIALYAQYFKNMGLFIITSITVTVFSALVTKLNGYIMIKLQRTKQTTNESIGVPD